MSDFRLALMLSVSNRTEPDRPIMVDCSVQVWRGHAHITTVKILDYGDLAVADDFDPSCIEQYASLTSRIAARMIDEEFYARVQHGKVHTLADLEKKYPPPTGL